MARQPSKNTLKARRAQAFRFRGRRALRASRDSRAGKGARVSWIVKRDWAPEPDPAIIVDHVRDVMLAAHRTAIRNGVKADGSGPQPIHSALDARLEKMTAGARKALETKLFGGGPRNTDRGMDTGFFADNLQADAIRVQGRRKMTKSVLDPSKKGGRRKSVLGTRAASTIYMAGMKPSEEWKRSAFLAQEAERGVEYLHTEGAMERLIDLAVDQAIEVAFLEGGSRDARMGALRAKDAIHSK